jgi:hypothetical protein
MSTNHNAVFPATILIVLKIFKFQPVFAGSCMVREERGYKFLHSRLGAANGLRRRLEDLKHEVKSKKSERIKLHVEE